MCQRDMRLVAASDEAVGSDWSEPLFVRPTWLLRAGTPGYHRSICQPTFGGIELPAALGS